MFRSLVKIFLGAVRRGDGRCREGAGAGEARYAISAARYAKHELARVECRGKAAPPKSRQGGQNDYQMRIIRISESIEDGNDSR